MAWNSLVLPALVCIFLPALWTICHGKSSRITSVKDLDRIEPPRGLEWMDKAEEGMRRKQMVEQKERKARAKKASKKLGRRQTMFPEDDDLFKVDFTALKNEGLQRYGNSYSIFEFDGKSNEGEVENGEPVRWFKDWERMVEREEIKKKNERRRNGVQKLRKLEAAKNKAKAPMANHRHSSISSSPSPSSFSSPHFEPTRRQFRNLRSPCLLRTENPVEHRTYPRSWEHPGFEAALPREWDWRNVSGENYCSPNRNQHIPVYCGGCWVFGTLGSLNDRFNVARKNRWPMTMLSPQEIIACNGQGSCNGGTAENVMLHAKNAGLVEEGCNNYKAVNEKCSPYTRCGSCWPDNCFAIQNYTRYYIKDFGKLSGRLQMMSEIHNRGPIACSMGCTSKFDLNYTGGIYEEFGEFPVNHIVSVTGWGWDENSKTEYWIVRNSWGDAWGEKGWFRVVTSIYKSGRGNQYNMGIERECYFADPDVSNLD